MAATTSEVLDALESIRQTVKRSRSTQQEAQNRLQSAYNQLDTIDEAYASEISTINGFTRADVYEQNSQDELAVLRDEAVALKADIAADLAALGVTV